MSINNDWIADIVERLRVKTLPQIGGYNGDYTDEEYVLETFAEAADEIERLRAALRGVIRVADRETVEFDAARQALGEFKTGE